MGNSFCFRVMGLYFGYPKCCIEWFVDRHEKATSRHDLKLPESQTGYNNGFLPCPECAKKVVPGTEHELIKNRYCSHLFPEEGDLTTEVKLAKSKIISDNLELLLCEIW